MALIREKSKGSIATIVILSVILAVIATFCIIAGIKAGQQDIGFFEALGQLFGVGGGTTPEPDVDSGVIEDAVEAMLKI